MAQAVDAHRCLNIGETREKIELVSISMIF